MENSSHRLPGLLLASFLGLTWLQGLRFYFSAVRRYCCFFPLENINTTFTKWCIALFQIILHLLIHPHEVPLYAVIPVLQMEKLSTELVGGCPVHTEASLPLFWSCLPPRGGGGESHDSGSCSQSSEPKPH